MRSINHKEHQEDSPLSASRPSPCRGLIRCRQVDLKKKWRISPLLGGMGVNIYSNKKFMERVKIVLKSGKEQSIRRFHPWIFSGAIKKMYGNPVEGDLVDVYD